MAGIRQHYIPRFLQAGFISHSKGNDIMSGIRKTGTPFNPNTKNIGLGTGFYNSEADSSVDDAITDVEGGYAQILNDIRLGNNTIDAG